VIPVTAALIVATGCGPGTDPVTYETRRLERNSGECDGTEREICGRFLAEYPEFTSGSSEAALDALNDAVRDMLLDPINAEARPAGVEELADRFIAEYEKARGELPGSSVTERWLMEKELTVVHDGPRAVTLRLDETAYTGGAHANSFARYRSLDPVTGSRFALDDLLKPEGRATLLEIAERRFRETREIPPDRTLSDAGYWFADDEFALNDNWGIVGGALVFHFDPYEIAPYATGAIELSLTLDDLEGIVRPDAPLGAQRPE
jgi:hypothetical protein